MLMSGLMIFNAHPRLYWGQYGANSDPAWLEIGSARRAAAILRIGPATLDTTGVLGRSSTSGRAQLRAFPGWATIPSDYDLARRARWHLTFAWVLRRSALLLYALWSLVNGHLRRDLLPHAARTRARAPLAGHQGPRPLRFPKGEAARRYNILQKLRLSRRALRRCCPLMVLTGLTMSPGMDAAWPWLLDLFGGRQSARSIHFICAALLVALHRRPPADGAPRRPVQRDPLDDHRPLPAAEGEA